MAEAEEFKVGGNLLEQHVGSNLEAAAAFARSGEERGDLGLHHNLADEGRRIDARHIHRQRISVFHAERRRVDHKVVSGRIV
ncbi:hypothetical protein D3C86_2084140 [compost metagenome]